MFIFYAVCHLFLLPLPKSILTSFFFLLQVFTSLALFNMLIGPLNAFPWVVNGLVEAWVSVKRVQQFVDLKTQLPSDFWSGQKGNFEF